MLKYIILTDFDGTMTRIAGEKGINYGFYRSLFTANTEAGYSRDPMKSDSEIQRLLNDHFGPYDVNNPPRGVMGSVLGQAEPQDTSVLLISPEAVKALKKALQDPEVAVNIVTKNRAQYVQALMRYQGFTDEEIQRVNIMELSNKYEDSTDYLNRIRGNVDKDALFIIKDDNIEDYMNMERAVRHFGFTQNGTARVHGRSLAAGTYNDDWAVTSDLRNLNPSVRTDISVPPTVKDQEKYSDIDFQLKVLQQQMSNLQVERSELNRKPKFNMLHPIESRREAKVDAARINEIGLELQGIEQKMGAVHAEKKQLEQEIQVRIDTIPTEKTIYSRGCSLKVGLNQDGTDNGVYRYENGKSKFSGSLNEVRGYIVAELNGAAPNRTIAPLLACIDKAAASANTNASTATVSTSSTSASASERTPDPAVSAPATTSSARGLKRVEAKKNLVDSVHQEKGYTKEYEESTSKLYKDESGKYILHYDKGEQLNGSLREIQQALTLASVQGSTAADNALIDLGSYVIKTRAQAAAPTTPTALQDRNDPEQTSTINPSI